LIFFDQWLFIFIFFSSIQRRRIRTTSLAEAGTKLISVLQW